MDDLIARIRAAIDDDERLALGATPGPWWHNPLKQWLDPDAFERYDRSKGEEFVGYGGSHPFTGCIAATGPADEKEAMRNADHVARHDPARVLRDVAKDRAMLDYLEHELHDDETQEWLRDLLRSMATAYGIEP